MQVRITDSIREKVLRASKMPSNISDPFYYNRTLTHIANGIMPISDIPQDKKKEKKNA